MSRVSLREEWLRVRDRMDASMPWTTGSPGGWQTVYLNQTSHYGPPPWPQFDLHALERCFTRCATPTMARDHIANFPDVTQFVVQAHLPAGYGADHVRAELGKACATLNRRWVELIGTSRQMSFIGGSYSIEPVGRAATLAQAWEMVIVISMRDGTHRYDPLYSNVSHPPRRPEPALTSDEDAVLAARAARREARAPQKRSGPKVDLGPKEIGR